MQQQPLGDLDLTTDHGEDPHSVPTASIVGSPDRVAALEAFTEARKALGDGDVERAVLLLDEASRLDPNDPLYPRYVQQVREKIEKQRQDQPTLPVAVPAAPSSTRKRILLIVLIGGVALLTAWGVTRPGTPSTALDVAQQHSELAPFTRLSAAPGGGWIGAVDQPLAAMDELKRQEWCRGILSALPRADQPSLLLRSTDGQVVACSL